MRIESSVTSVTWIPSEAIKGMPKMPFEMGIAHYDEPPPDRIDDLEALHENDLFREANEGIREAAEDHLEGGEQVPFLCECADENCRELVQLTLAEYQSIRSDPRLFVNVAGHQASAHGWAEAIASRDGHVVVEKVGPAGDLAEELEGEDLLPSRERL